MPPEPLPWDRKDFFKEKKHERSESIGSLGDGRWKGSSSHCGSRDFPGWGSADFRRPPGHAKQGGPHVFTEEPGHGHGVSRSCDKMLEDENYRPSSRGEGKYGRSSRDNRGYFSERDYRGHFWKMSNGSANVFRRPSDFNNDPRLVDDAHGYPHNSHPDFMNTWDQQVKMDNGSGTGQRCDIENGLGSVDWKTLKWNRSGSLTSRGSGLIHSSSSRINGGVDSGEVKTAVLGKSANPVGSLPWDAACVTSSAPSEETTSRKKPRLGWGEGLAKYEKKKIVAPDVRVIKDVDVVSNSVSNPSPSVGISLLDKSPKLARCSGCASPATPSSVACSSSPGLEDKLFGKVANVDHDVSTSSDSPSPLSKNHIERLPFHLENLASESLATLGSSITELLQEDVGSVDSISTMSSAMSKLLIWKCNASKVLEITESEIDLFETELKSLKSGLGDGGPHLEASSSFKVGNDTNHSEECAGDPNTPSHLRKVEIVTSAEENMEIQPIGNLQSHNETGKDEDIDSPETATSNFDEPMPLVHAVKNGACLGDVSTIRSSCLEMKRLIACSNRNDMKTCGDADILDVKESVGIAVVSNNCSSISNSLYDVITAANRKLANSASEMLGMLLPKDCCMVDKLGATGDIGNQNDALMKEKFASRKRLLKFREGVAAIKFRALRHLWKEDMRLLSIKKSRPKSHKKFEIGLWASVSGYQKPRSSVRSRVAFPGNLSLVPTSDMIAYTKKLLSTSQLKPLRSTLKIPEMILDDKKASRFVSNNGLVEDPLTFERERAMVNPWTLDEKEIFLDKLAIYGKDFCKIASFLDHKTTADCVEFYYKNHKSESFQNIKKQRNSSGTTKLVLSGSKWNRDTSGAYLDILSAVSAMAGQVDGLIDQQKMRAGRSLLGGYSNVKSSKCSGVLERSKCLVITSAERETVAAADVLAGISSSFSPEGISSCITNSVELAEDHRKHKCLKADSNMQQTKTPDVTQLMDEETCSDDGSVEMDPSDWTDEEKATFLQAVSSYGKDFAMISRCVRTKSRDQCKIFFSKAQKCLGLDILYSRLQNEGSPVNQDANGGGTDAEDACAFEAGSVTSTNQFGDRMEGDLLSSVKNVFDDESDPVDTSNLSVDGLNKSDTDEQGEQDVDIMISDSSTVKDSSELVLDGDSNVSCGSHKEPCLAQAGDIEGGVEQTTEVGNVCAESISDAGGIGAGASISDVVEKKLVSPVTNVEVFKRKELVPGNDLYDGDYCKADAESNEILEVKCSVQYSFSNDNVLNLPGDIPCSLLENQQNVPLAKPEATLLPEENSHSAMNSTSKSKTDSTHQLSSTLEFKESSTRKSHKSVRGCQEHVSGQRFAENVKPPDILKGYPLQMSINNERNDDASYNSSITELPFRPQKVEQLSDHSTSNCQSFSDTEKTCKIGDVKLFGKILTNHSVQKSNLVKNHECEKGSRNERNGSKSSCVKFSSPHNPNGNSAVMKFDRSNCLGLENIPISSGYWDGNRIQTGISPTPDSALLLAKYPAAFGNYTTTGPRLEQLSFQTVSKVTERSLGGVSSFEHREISCSNEVVDYAMYRSRDGPKLQHPFAIDVKHRQDICCEVQRRNGFETLGSLHPHQQLGRNTIVGINGVGRPGILVGGSCAGVSDPMAAIRLHYANIVDQYGGQNESIGRENESWSGKADIGR